MSLSYQDINKLRSKLQLRYARKLLLITNTHTHDYATVDIPCSFVRWEMEKVEFSAFENNLKSTRMKKFIVLLLLLQWNNNN